ncbi:MAG: glycosyltransferase family 4 protein [Pseudomonadota bacterium]
MTRKPRLIAINRFYWPDHSATSQILTDLAEALAEEGWEVEVLTSRLRYDDPDAKLAARETAQGVSIRRLWSTRFGRRSTLGRGIDYLSFYASAFLTVLGAARRGDVVLAKTDPPLISIPASWASRLKGARLVTWNQDLFPEVADALGVPLSRGPLGRVLRWLRNGSLRRAEVNVAIGERMREILEQQGVSAERIRVAHNWCDADIAPIPTADNPLRQDWGLNGRIVIGYSGNLGRAHAADKVAQLVEATGDVEGLTWLFVGGGAGLAKIRTLAERLPKGQVVFQPYQPRSKLAESLSVPDIHLVTLDPACEGLIVPSKFYGCIAAGRPVAMLGDANGEVARMVGCFDVGMVLPFDRPELWRDRIGAMLADPARLAVWQQNAAETARKQFHAQIAIRHWIDILTEARGAMPEERAATERPLPAPAPLGPTVIPTATPASDGPAA